MYANLITILNFFKKINNGAINHVDQGAPHVQVKLTVTVLIPFLFYNPPPNLSE